jgi:error-prone DNA polymerase
MDPFVHLHVASGYSLKYGASHPHRLVERAVEAEMDTLSLTDRDGVYGAVRFVKACMSACVRPVLGVDLAIAPSGLLGDRAPALDRDRVPAGSVALPARARTTGGSDSARAGASRMSPARGGAYREPALPRITVLAGSKVGWAALCRLVSATHLRGERGTPITTQGLVAEHLAPLDSGHDALVLLGPGSELGWAATRRRDVLAREVLHSWREVIDPVSLVVEVVSHRVPGHGPHSSSHAARMAKVASTFGLQTVLTNAVRYADRSDAPAADILDSVRRLVPLDPRHVDRVNAEGFLKSGKEMADIADEICRLAGLDTREADRLLARTRAVADRCALDPRADLGLGEVHFPDLDVTAGGGAGAGIDLATLRHGIGSQGRDRTLGDAVLRARCEAGIGRRYAPDQHDAVRQRLDDELDVVSRLGYASYFLTVADVTDLIRAMGVRVAARGSGAGSVVNYLLGVSGVDPIRYRLLMERFLSPLRQALPDIDIDVESARRTEVYERILERYTGERCACVSMMDTYRVRHAIRDVGAALGMPGGEVDAIAKAFPHIRARDARAALRELPELRASGLGEERLDVLFGLVEKLDGLPRHIAVHPCGVLLSDTTLLDRTPVEASFLGFPMSQFDKDDVEDLGLLKLDVLGIRMQSAMAHAVDEIRRIDGVEIDLDEEGQVARDDPATYALIQSTKTLGCFQIESPGQRELVGKFGPESFDDIIIDISLFRPGPVKSDMVVPFLRARQGWSTPEYVHDDLRDVLGQTDGVVVFHEQVIEMIALLTGCTLAEADEARRALGDRDGQRQTKLWFFPRALGLGYPQFVVQRCWQVLEAFASFGFCKAHAAAFALPTFQSAWLKAHYPAAFLAGVLTHDPGMYPKRLILDDARQFGIEVLPLDVNASDDIYRVERVDPSHFRRKSSLAVGLRADEMQGGEGADTRAKRIGDDDNAADHRSGVDGAGYGIRLSLMDVKGISDAEVARIIAARPFHSLTDLWQRARPSRPIAERLVLAGGLDTLYGIGSPVAVRPRGRVTRRDLLLQVAELDRWSRATDRAVRAASSSKAVSARRIAAATAEPGPERSGYGRTREAGLGRAGPGVAAWADDRQGIYSHPAKLRTDPGAGPGPVPGGEPHDPFDPRLLAAAQSQAAREVEPVSAVQLTLDLDDAPALTEASGLPEMSAGERVRAELEILGLDVSSHVVDFYGPMLTSLGITWSRDLLHRRSRSELLVAGVKVATQTPPIRSGRRVIFLTLDDGTGPVDATFFEDAQGPYAATLFHSWLLLVRGELRRTGPKGVSLRATGCWELPTLYDVWRGGGPDAVRAVMAELPLGFSVVSGDDGSVQGAAESRSTRPVMTRPAALGGIFEGGGVFGSGDSGGAGDDGADDGGVGHDAGDGGSSTAGGMGRRRVLVHASGFKQSPYSDIKPAGESTKSVPRTLWHRSPGSSG